jgi:uncharacterized protein (DUF2141 family)
MSARAIFVMACAAALPSAASAATVQVTVHDVRNDHGRVLVALCTSAEFLRPRCAWNASAPAVNGTVRLRIDGVPPGTYAAQAFHDENGNGRLDRGIFGIPEEGMGFSRDAPMHMAPPRFADAEFAVIEPVTAVDFRLRYR